MEQKDIIHKELSYRIIGIMFEVFNNLGAGYQEKYYQRAIKLSFEQAKIHFLEQVRTALSVKNHDIGCYYIDFIVDHKIVLEIKSKSNFSRKDVFQVLGYLKKSGLDLGILVTFSSSGLKFKRILRGFGK